MKLFRLAAIGVGVVWFLDRRLGPARRARAAETLRGLAGRARGLFDRSGLDLDPSEPRPHPEVHEEKSFAELEPGLYSATPAPTSPSSTARGLGASDDEPSPEVAERRDPDGG